MVSEGVGAWAAGGAGTRVSDFCAVDGGAVDGVVMGGGAVDGGAVDGGAVDGAVVDGAVGGAVDGGAVGGRTWIGTRPVWGREPGGVIIAAINFPFCSSVG